MPRICTRHKTTAGRDGQPWFLLSCALFQAATPVLGLAFSGAGVGVEGAAGSCVCCFSTEIAPVASPSVYTAFSVWLPVESFSITDAFTVTITLPSFTV